MTVSSFCESRNGPYTNFRHAILWLWLWLNGFGRKCHKFRVNGIGIERIVASRVGQVTHGEIFRSARKAARRQHAPK